MKKSMQLFISYTLLTIISAAAFADDKLTTRTIEVEGFSIIENSTPGSIELIQADETKVVVEAEAEVFDQLVVEENGDKLILTSKNKKGFFNWSSPFNNKQLHFIITTPTISALSLRSSGDLSSKNIKTGDLKIGIYGSGNAKISSIESEELDIGIHGSGHVVIGEVTAVEMNSSIHGSGEIDFEKLSAKQSAISIHGSGDVSINELNGDALNMGIHGSGDIRLPKLNLQTVSGAVHGSGDIRLGGKADTVKVKVHGSGDVKTSGLVANSIIIK